MSLQDQINEEIKGGIAGDTMTPEERKYFATLEGEERENFKRNFISSIKDPFNGR